MYFIPKNIKIKKEIFKGFGIIEILSIGISILIGFISQSLVNSYSIKVFLFVFFPITTFLLLIPLPNGNNVFKILKKYFIYIKRQRKYKYKN